MGSHFAVTVNLDLQNGEYKARTMPFARLRFGPVINSAGHAPSPTTLQQTLAKSARKTKSKLGCQQCKTKRVKCDESRAEPAHATSSICLRLEV